MDPNPECGASDELEMFFSWLPWARRGTGAHRNWDAGNGTARLWIFSPATPVCSDPATMIGYCDQAQGSIRAFYSTYRAVGGSSGRFDGPNSGQHNWGTWGAQLVAMSGDFVAATK